MSTDNIKTKRRKQKIAQKQKQKNPQKHKIIFEDLWKSQNQFQEHTYYVIIHKVLE